MNLVRMGIIISLKLRQFLQKMGIKEVKELISNSILRMDLLSAKPSFRTRQQPVYQTMAGGVMSIIILSVFYYFLYTQMVSMLSNLKISYNQGLDDNVHSTSSLSSFPFAVAIEGVDLAALPRKFIVQLRQEKRVANASGPPASTSSGISLSPCNYSDWKDYGSHIQHQYQGFGFDQMLCITKGQNLAMSGYSGSDLFQFLNLQVHECNQTIDGNCDSVSNINSFMASHLSTHNYFKLKIFVLDTIIAPDSHQPISYMLEQNIFLAFTSSMGSVGHINLAQFNLVTDSSLFPVSSYSTQKGQKIQGFASNAVSLSSTMFIQFHVYRSTKTLTINRTLGKIDTVLSYVGGLFSLLFTALSFLFGSYSEYKYELYVAESTLTNKGRAIKSNDLGFCTYLAYACYDWMATFGIAPECLPTLKAIHEVREESCDQLDPSIVLKRIKHLEDISKILINEHRDMCLHLVEPLSLDQARKMRKTLRFYDDLMEQLRENNVIQSSYPQPQKSTKKNAIKNESQVRMVKKENVEEKTEEEEQEMMKLELLESVQKIELDHTETANRIKQKVPNKVREYICLTKKYDAPSEMETNKLEFELIVPSRDKEEREEKESSFPFGSYREAPSKVNILKVKDQSS